MKNKNAIYLILFAFCISLCSCSKEGKIQANVEENFKIKFNDPKSYEFIDLQVLDTVTLEKAVDYKMNTYSSYVLNGKQYVKNRKKEMAEMAMNSFLSGFGFHSQYDLDELNAEKARLDVIENDSIPYYEKKIEGLKKIKKTKEILYYRYLYNYRVNNELGALIKHLDTVRVDENNELILNHEQLINDRLKV